MMCPMSIPLFPLPLSFCQSSWLFSRAILNACLLPDFTEWNSRFWSSSSTWRRNKENSKVSKGTRSSSPLREIQKNQRFAAPTALSHSAKIVGGALFRVCTSSSVSFGFETKAFAWLKLSGTPSVITSKGWSCCMKRWVKSTVSKHMQLQQ